MICNDRLGRLVRPDTWPLTVRIPAVVVGLMIMVSAVISERVLTRLIDTQKRHLSELTSAYLDGIASAVLPHVIREDVWEIFDVVDRAANEQKALDVAWTTVARPDGVIIASSEPAMHATQQSLPPELHEAGRRQSGSVAIVDSDVARFRRELVHQNRTVGIIIGEVQIKRLIEERWSVLMTLVLTNALLTLLLAAAGYFMIRRMLKPVSVLAEHMRVDADGDLIPITKEQLGSPGSEFGRLFRRYNSLVMTVRERQRLVKTLAEEERLAALGRLASGMAHEINNPLGGMLNAVQTLRRHGDREEVRLQSASLIERGLEGIRNVVRSALATYRVRPEMQVLTPENLDDLATLIEPELKRKSLQLDWQNSGWNSARVAVHHARDASLNLLLNACAAAPVGSTIEFAAKSRDDKLFICVSDRGPGLPDHLQSFLQDRKKIAIPAAAGGLGLWIVKRLVHEAAGAIAVESRSDGGTSIHLTFPQLSIAIINASSPEFSDVA